MSCGGSSSPTTPTNPGSGGPGTSAGSCRNYASVYSYVTTAGGLIANTTARCGFDSGTRVLTCTFAQTSSMNTCSVDFVWRDTYNSVGDFVRESKTVGKLLLLSRTSDPVTTATSCSGPGVTGNTTYSYDGSQRLVQSVAVSSTGVGSPTITNTYNAWDSEGRPTAGAIGSSIGPTFPVTVVYDDNARTRAVTATVGSGAGSVNTFTFDADGNIVRLRGESSALTVDSIYTITARQTVCQ